MASLRDMSMVPIINDRDSVVNQRSEMSSREARRRHRSSQVSERKISKFHAQNRSNGFGNSLIKPAWKVNSRFEKVGMLTRDGSIQVETEQHVPGRTSRSFSNQDQIISKHKVINIPRKVRIKTRQQICMKGMVEDGREVLSG